MIQFYDSTDLPDIPDDATHLAAYHDGIGAVTTAQIRRTKPNIQYVRWITIAADPHCAISDFEPPNPCFTSPPMLRNHAADRQKLNMSTPITYVNRSNAGRALRRLEGLRSFWWITVIDPQDPGAQHPWTPQELSHELTTRWDAPIPAARIWGCQWQNTPRYDLSDLFLGWWA